MLYLLPPLENCNKENMDAGTQADLPADFDTKRLPIVARHWFGWEPIGTVAARVVQDIEFRRKAQRLHAKGPRLIAELLAELAASHSLGTVIDQSLDRYLALDDAALDILNGRELPPTPLHEVSQ